VLLQLPLPMPYLLLTLQSLLLWQHDATVAAAAAAAVVRTLARITWCSYMLQHSLQSPPHADRTLTAL
jgi:hypothetical protein